VTRRASRRSPRRSRVLGLVRRVGGDQRGARRVCRNLRHARRLVAAPVAQGETAVGVDSGLDRPRRRSLRARRGLGAAGRPGAGRNSGDQGPTRSICSSARRREGQEAQAMSMLVARHTGAASRSAGFARTSTATHRSRPCLLDGAAASTPTDRCGIVNAALTGEMQRRDLRMVRARAWLCAITRGRSLRDPSRSLSRNRRSHRHRRPVQ
jgi:hypothetical protein